MPPQDGPLGFARLPLHFSEPFPNICESYQDLIESLS
jgi:hypothetical protein